MIAALVALSLASAPGAFPIPGQKGQSLDAKATHFHLPQQFDAVARFYRAEFRGAQGVSLMTLKSSNKLIIRSSRAGDAWARAEISEDAVGTSIQVTPLLRMDASNVQGEPPPVAMLVIERSAHVKEQLDQIGADHAPEH